MLDKLLMSRPFRRYLESWAVVLMPWLLFTEREAVTIDGVFPLAKSEKDDCVPAEDCNDCTAYGTCSGCLAKSMKRDLELTPEEEKEMEDRRVVWNEDDWRKSPTDVCKKCRGTGKLWGDSDCWGQDSYLGYTCPCQK